MANKISKGVIKKVREYVKARSGKEENPFGFGFFRGHVLPVVRFARRLARLTETDGEIVEIAAWLHDLGSLYGFSVDHHLAGAELTEKFLSGLEYDEEKSAAVKHCVAAHRGSEDVPPETPEARCVASADGMAHVTSLGYLLKLHTVVLGKSAAEARAHLRRKLRRSWDKIMPEGRELVREEYETAMFTLDSAQDYRDGHRNKDREEP
jgi:hypothetical protein